MKVLFFFSHCLQRALLNLPLPSFNGILCIKPSFFCQLGYKKVKSSLNFNVIFSLAFIPSAPPLASSCWRGDTISSFTLFHCPLSVRLSLTCCEGCGSGWVTSQVWCFPALLCSSQLCSAEYRNWGTGGGNVKRHQCVFLGLTFFFF